MPKQQPGNKWNNKWLRLETAHHPKLKELERELGLFCSDMARDPKRGRTLVLFGENGSGKTHSAKAVRNWVCAVGHTCKFVPKPNHITHLQCLFWRWPELLDTFKNGGWDVVEDMMEIPLLIIDELGGGHDPSRAGVDKLCQVLSRREGKWTMITTNVLPSAWEEAFDRRVASRFFRSAVHVDLTDVPDYGVMGGVQ